MPNRSPIITLTSIFLALAVATTVAPVSAQTAAFVNWESPQSHPIDITPNGLVVLAVNTADAQLEIFDVANGSLTRRGSIAVGLDPVSVRARSNTQAWVVNQISDSISVIDIATMRVTKTITIGDEPADVVFAGSPQKAFVSLSMPEKLAVVDATTPNTITTVNIAGSSPRALAVSPDGSKIYLAIFESGNHSTMVPEASVNSASGPYGGQNPPPNSGTAFSPTIKSGLATPPKVSQIVRKNAANRWLDGNGRDWTSLVTWDVHDNDVAVVNASSLAVTYIKGLMTIVSGIAVAPNGNVLAVGMESRNELRFEQNVNGVFIRCMGALLPSGAAGSAAFDINPHLSYTSSTTADKSPSIGDPRGVAFNSAGTTAYVAGLGSNNVIAMNASSGARSATITVGEGPTGLVTSPDGTRLYVLDRFEGAVSVVSTGANMEIARVTFHDSTPATVKAGRPFLYDTHLTSGLGQASCASCHVDGRSDRIAWDIGNPQGSVKTFDQKCQVGGCISWNPMKGPMTSQTLVGIIGNQPFHWRGEKVELSEFNEAYTNLQGRSSQITDTEMSHMSDYLASLTFGPNPNRNIDGTMKSTVTVSNGTGNPTTGQTIFNSSRIFGAPPGLTCVDCHAGTAGTNNKVDIPGPTDDQNKKNVPLRDVYRKVGASKSSQVANRGFGFDHSGEEGTIQDVLNIGFGFPQGATGATQKRDVEAFVLSFGSDTHAGVGAQAFAIGVSDDTTRIAQLISIATSQSTQVGLIVKGNRAGIARGWLFQGGTFVSDLTGESISPALLLAGASAGNELTYTLVPAGMARRLGIDRDGDGALDQDEILAGTDPASTPCLADLDGDHEITSGDIGIILLAFGPASPGEPADLDGNNSVDSGDIGMLLLDSGPCP